MPSIERKDLSPNHLQVSIIVTREELKPQLDAELKKFRQKASIKGFRPGQAPASFVKNMYGKSLFADKIGKMFSDELHKFLDTTKLQFLGQPLPISNDEKYKFSIDNPDPEYRVHYEIGYVSEFEVQGLDGSMTLEKYAVADLDEVAKNDLDYARRRAGTRTNPETEILENDMLVIDAKEAGGDFETKITVLVKTIHDEAFKNQLLSMKKGDTFKFDARKMENFKDEKMYRKYILKLEDDDIRVVNDLFHGTIEEVSRLVEAELDEEFLKKNFGEGVTNEPEAIEKLKANVAGFYNSRADAIMYRDLQVKLLEINPVELPEDFLKRWLLSENKDLTMDKIEAEFQPFSENIRWSLIRDNIKAAHNIEVTKEDIFNAYWKNIAGYFQGQVADEVISDIVNRMMTDEKETKKLRKDLEFDKLFTFLGSKVNVVEKPIGHLEFQKIFDEITAKTPAIQGEDEDFED